MFLNNVKIRRPKTTKIQSKNGNSYVFQVVSSTYHPDKKYNTDKRVSIGKMIDDEFMIPNERFALYYPELLSPKQESPDFSDTLKVGGFLIIDKVMEELGISALLESTYDKAETIKDIVAYMILEQTSVYQHFPSFIFNHPSFEKKVRSDSYISELLNNISDDEIQTFNTNWANLNAMSQKIYIHYDGTNMNTCSEGIEIAEFGHAKDNCDLPQVNISMATNSLDSTPLFYELYPGSIIDNSQCKYMVDLAEEYGLKDVGFILDRGYFSKSNMRYFREHGHEYIMMIKTNSESARSLIREHSGVLRRNNSYYIGDHSVFGFTTKAKLYIDDKQEHYFHIYYDSRRAESQRVDSLDMIDKMERELNGKLAKKTAVEGELSRFKKYFKLRFDNNGYFMSYSRDDKAIDTITDQFGFFVIVTTEEMSASKAIDTYRDRDGVEKVFRALKSELGCATFGVHSTASLKAKVQLSFIASIVRNRIFQRLKSLVGKDRKTYTVNASMNIVENIEVSRNSEGVYARRYALNAEQKKVLDAFGLNEEHLNSWISNHATKLSKKV